MVVPRGTDASGLYPISVLDPDAGVAIQAVHYYDKLVSFLEVRRAWGAAWGLPGALPGA